MYIWENIQIYEGYLAIECLDLNEEESQVCGFCGVVPEAVLGKLANLIGGKQEGSFSLIF